MKNMQKYLFASLATASFLSMVKPALADTSENAAQLQKVTSQTNALESQIKLLKSEIRQLKTAQNNFKKAQKTHTIQTTHTTQTTAEHPKNISNFSSAANYLTGTPIVIAPYIGDRREFNASDLIINYSDYNEDLNLLKLRQNIYQKFNHAETSSPTSSFLMFSGKIEGLGFYQKSSPNPSASGVSLEDAELDIMPMLNEWASGYMAINYSQGTELPESPVVTNSTRLHISKAFLTLGNLEKFPLYATIGQFNVPFGAYSSSMISSPATTIFKTRAQALLLGYSPVSDDGVYAQAYAFNGDTHTNRTNSIDDIGANLGYKFSQQGWHSDVGIGVINNVADSLVMQNTGAGGFSKTRHQNNPTPEKIQRRVAGIDAHASLGAGQYSFNSEYIRSTSAFNPLDMSFNGDGAQPQAFNLEGSYSFHLFEKPAAVSAGFNKTWNALALMAPEKSYLAALTTSIWKDTIQELEYRHDVNYSSTDKGSIAGLTVPGTGGSKNTITAQIGIYF